jgi:hypothetical protein
VGLELRQALQPGPKHSTVDLRVLCQGLWIKECSAKSFWGLLGKPSRQGLSSCKSLSFSVQNGKSVKWTKNSQLKELSSSLCSIAYLMCSRYKWGRFPSAHASLESMDLLPLYRNVSFTPIRTINLRGGPCSHQAQPHLRGAAAHLHSGWSHRGCTLGCNHKWMCQGSWCSCGHRSDPKSTHPHL